MNDGLEIVDGGTVPLLSTSSRPRVGDSVSLFGDSGITELSAV